MENKDYGTEFYQGQKSGSLASAEELLPVVFDLVHPKSIVDFGCGVGTWLGAARKLGATEAFGIEGTWVSASDLVDPDIEFMNADLEQRLSLDRRFDLAISMEVGEHLKEDSARRFVASICAVADIVLFSAAIPGQLGRAHINEQWPSYWAERFAENGYTAVDLVRPKVWRNERIEWYYRQNALVYLRRDSDAGRVLMDKIGPQPPFVLDVVHPNLFAERTSFRGGLGAVKRGLLSQFGGSK